MAKLSKPVIFGLSSVAVLFVVIVAFLIPFGGRTVLARSLDTLGQHKAALGTDLLFQGKANGFLQNLSTLDLSKPDQCSNLYKILQNEKLNIFQGIAGSSKTVIKPAANDKVLLEAIFSGSINPNTKKASANLEVNSKVDPNSLSEILTEMNATQLLSTVPNDVSGQVSGFFDLDKMLFSVNKFNLKTSDINSSNGLTNYYEYGFKNKDAAKETLRQEGWSEIFGELKTLTDVKFGDIISEESYKTLSQSTCQTVEKVEVLAPVEKDFGNGKVSLRPIVMTYKPNALNIQIEAGSKTPEILAKDQKLKEFLYSRYPSIKKIAISSEKITGTAPESNGKPLKNLNEEENKIAEKGYRDGIDKAFSEMSSVNSQQANSYKEMEKYYTLGLPPSVTYLNASTGDIYGGESSAVVTLTEETTKNLSPKVKALIGEVITIESTYYNIQYGDAVKDLAIPTNTKSVEEFMKDIYKTDGAKQIQSKIPQSNENITSDMSGGMPNTMPSDMSGGLPYDPTNPNGGFSGGQYGGSFDGGMNNFSNPTTSPNFSQSPMENTENNTNL